MSIQMLTSPTGEDAGTISREDYENLVDARQHAIALREFTSGKMPVVSDDDMDAYLAAPTPLAFWRKHRGLTQKRLADAVEVTQDAPIKVGRITRTKSGVGTWPLDCPSMKISSP